MKRIVYDFFPNNIGLLHQEMESAIGRARFFSISNHPQEGVIFQVADDVTRSELDGVIGTHDPTQKTEQEQRKESAAERLDWLINSTNPQGIHTLVDNNRNTEALHEIIDILEALIIIIKV